MQNDSYTQPIPAFFQRCVEKFPENIYLRENKGQGYTGITYREVFEQVQCLAAGLIRLGIEKGERVALWSEARNEWIVSELAILSVGAVSVPLSPRMNEPEDIRYRIHHSGASFIFVSGKQLPKIRTIIRQIPDAEKIIVLDDDLELLENEYYYSDILKDGTQWYRQHPNVVQERADSILPDDYANISYTSGTTSDPKGIILTHRNFIVNVQQAYSLLDISEDFVILLILPWDHAFAHTAGIYGFMGKGASIASVQNGKTPQETLRNIPKNIREVKPHILFSVPAVAKNFRKNIEKGISDQGRFAEFFFHLALRITESYNGLGIDRGGSWRFLLRPLVKFFDMFLYSKIRKGFGGRLHYFIGGGALLDLELQKFFYAIGIPMLQGYGLTEASPVISANPFHGYKLGSSGKIVSELDLKICDEKGMELPVGASGEIVIRGGNVMAGYWKNPEATAATIKSGWLYTGDMGYMTKEGFLYVLGRNKSLLIADDGEKYSPEGMEEIITTQSPFIDQCMLYNDQNPYTIILIWPDTDKLRSWLNGIQSKTGQEKRIDLALERIKSEINEYRTGGRYETMFPQRWIPAAIGILPEGFSEENHLLNFQLKTVRGKVVEKYKDLISYLYTPAGKAIRNEENRKTMIKLLELKSY